MLAMDSTGLSPSSDRSLENSFVFVLFIALIGVTLRALFVLASGLWQPLLDLHSFRQTQTALSAYWLLRGGPWLAYETPVLGAPWSIPFEFPLYQWIVAIIATTGLPLDGAGRLVAFGFYLATLWPIYILFRAVGLGRIAFLSTGILFMTSPLYLFWSRTFLMESCSLVLFLPGAGAPGWLFARQSAMDGHQRVRRRYGRYANKGHDLSRLCRRWWLSYPAGSWPAFARQARASGTKASLHSRAGDYNTVPHWVRLGPLLRPPQESQTSSAAC